MSVGRHTTYNIVGSIIPIAVALITVPIYLHLIGPDRYGVLSVAWLLLGYFGLFDLGLGRATSFRIAALKSDSGQARADTFWAAAAVNLGVGVIGGALLWVAAHYFFAYRFKVDEHLRPEMLAAVPLLAASVPVATLTGVLTGAMQGREKFLETNLVSVISTTLFQIFPLTIAASLGPNLVFILYGALAARILALMFLGYRCYVEVAKGFERRLARAEIPKLLGYGGWVTVASIFGPLLVILDRVVIGSILGAVAVAIYTVPFQLAQRISILPSALTNALFPRMSSADAAERQELGDMALRAFAALVSPPVLIGILLLDPFLRLWVGDKISMQSAEVGRILMIGFWANAFALVPYTRLQASGRPDLVTKALLLQIPPYLVGLWAGLTYLGIIGSAIAFCVRCIVDFCVLAWMADRKIKHLNLLGLYFLILAAAATVSTLWPISDIRWWLSAGGLILTTGFLGWGTLPSFIRDRVLARAANVMRTDTR